LLTLQTLQQQQIKSAADETVQVEIKGGEF